MRLVGNCIFIIEHRSVRKIFENTWNDILCVFSAEGRARNDLCKITDLTVGIDRRKKLFFFYRIDLVAERTLKEVDAIMWLVEPSTFVGAGERHIAEQLQKVVVPVILIINKIDTGICIS